ncbi:MAG: nickel pincer cofactor biosynthesis protein LarC [Bacilli bacterium]
MTVAYIECAAGASGDMFLGAWLDLAIAEDAWRGHLASLRVQGYEVAIERVKKSGIAATRVAVLAQHSDHHRRLPDIWRIIDESGLPAIVKVKSKEAFGHLAAAEAAVHGVAPERIHFHEVGAVDAIVDIVGSMIAWHLLGQPDCVVTPIEVGGGTVACEHGAMPVPAPATARLLEGFPTYSSGLWGETTTPTGAAVIRTLAKPAAQRPFVSRMIGYGAGSKELPVANVLRIQLGEWAHGAVHPDGVSVPLEDRVLPVPVPAVMIEANVDDMNPELAGHVIDRLLRLGAMDASWTPMVMKKGRPAIQLQVLCDRRLAALLQQEIFRETSSIGLRCHEVEKVELAREVISVETAYGPVEVKVARLAESIVNAAPEYESCRRISEEKNIPVKQVYQAALAQAASLYQA